MTKSDPQADHINQFCTLPRKPQKNSLNNQNNNSQFVSTNTVNQGVPASFHTVVLKKGLEKRASVSLLLEAEIHPRAIWAFLSKLFCQQAKQLKMGVFMKVMFDRVFFCILPTP